MDKLRYKECRTGRRFIIQREPGTRITAAPLDFARSKHLPFASLVSVVGSVCDVECTGIRAGAHLPMTEPRFRTHRLEGPLALISLEGNIACNAEKQLTGQFYILGSKSNGGVVGGRLVEGNVFVSCETVLAEYLAGGIERRHSATSSVDTIDIGESS